MRKRERFIAESGARRASIDLHPGRHMRVCVLKVAAAGAIEMTSRDDKFHYLRTSLRRGESGKYHSESEAMNAMSDLIELQSGRGFRTKREKTGKYMSKHPDGRSLQFWVESHAGEVVS
jgi:hypothetical protein